MKQRPLRIGFDLDGVLLYNPARIVRPLVVFFKKIFIPKEQNKFHLPKTKIEEIIWLFLHKSSFMITPGYDEIKKLVSEKKIEAYIISGRYDSLKEDFYHWINKLDATKYFSGLHYNSGNEQPHIYKERMIKKLKLDIFVEDNWDIVSHLANDGKLRDGNCKVFWIYNIFDRGIPYRYKFPHLKKIIDFIQSMI